MEDRSEQAVDADETAEVVENRTWLEKMSSYLRWKVVGPDIKNPFAPQISDMILRRILNDHKMLFDLMDLRCTCDGHEVLYIRNINNPLARSDHPCVRTLNQTQILEAVNRLDLSELIQLEADKILLELKAEYERRKIAKTKSGAAGNSGKTLKEIKAEAKERKALDENIKSGQKTPPEAQFRILKK